MITRQAVNNGWIFRNGVSCFFMKDKNHLTSKNAINMILHEKAFILSPPEKEGYLTSIVLTCKGLDLIEKYPIKKIKPPEV